MAEKKKGFDLAAALGEVSKLDTGAPTIEMIDIDRIDANDANFYALRDLDALAGSIALDGLQQPLVVMTSPEDPSRVRLLSGHRRRAAIKMLVEDANAPREDLRMVPCIRRTYASGAMAELQLIMANSTARVLTSAEVMRQAARIETLLVQLKEEGVSFPGKMRDQVAAACQVSASKLARLKVIRDNLAPPLLKRYEAAKLAEQTAYAIARMAPELQSRIAAARQKTLDGYTMEQILRSEQDYTGRGLTCKGGSPCSNADGFLAHDLSAPTWRHCQGTVCCLKCHYLSDCKHCCPAAQKKKEKEKNREAAQRAAAEKEAETCRAREKELTAAYCRRVMAAVERNAVDFEAAMRVAGAYRMAHNRESFIKLAQGDATGFFHAPSYYPDGNRFGDFCRALGCSADWLLGLTPDPSLAPTGASWRSSTDDPPPDGVEVVGYRVADGRLRVVCLNGGNWQVRLGSEMLDSSYSYDYWIQLPAGLASARPVEDIDDAL